MFGLKQQYNRCSLDLLCTAPGSWHRCPGSDTCGATGSTALQEFSRAESKHNTLQQASSKLLYKQYSNRVSLDLSSPQLFALHAVSSLKNAIHSCTITPLLGHM
jgi:hypothetical protein